MRRAAALLACGMVLVLASGGLASSGNPDVQLLSASITFGGETCTIDNLPEVAVHWPGCEADEATASCAPTVFPGEVIRIAPEIVCLAAESPFNVRFSWRRQDAASDCGFLVLPFDPSDSPLEIQAEMNTTGLAPGCYVVTVWADSENVVFETDELNNRLVFSVRIDAPQPNLHPNALRVSTVSPIERGETFMLHAEVLNIGLADAGPFAVHFLSAPADSDIELCGGTLIQYVKDGAVQRWVDVIGADGSAACPLSPGQNPLGPWAHLGTVHVEGLARDDARLVSISVDTDEEELFPDENETYIVQVLVDPGLCTVEVLSASDDSTGDAVSQTEQVLPGGAVHESFESDNCLATSFRLDENWKRRPELRPISLHLTPPSPIEWRSSSIAAVTVENTGGSVPTSVMQLHFYYRSKGGSDAGWRRLETYEVGRPDERVAIELDSEPGIEQGRNTVSRSVRLHFDSDPGAYELKVLVDAEDDEREQNDDNNELSIGFTIIGSELHPRGLSMASRRISQGDSVAVSVDVENTGKKDVADFTVGFFVDGARMDTFYYFADDANRLAEGESAMVTGFIDTTDLPVGEHILRVVVDPDDRIPEIDEANNEISASLNIEPPMGRKPELQVEQVAIGSDSGSSSLAPAVIQATVINRGDLAAEGVSVDLLTCVDCVSCLSGGFDQAVGDSQSYWIDRENRTKRCLCLRRLDHQQWPGICGLVPGRLPVDGPVWCRPSLGDQARRQSQRRAVDFDPILGGYAPFPAWTASGDCPSGCQRQGQRGE